MSKNCLNCIYSIYSPYSGCYYCYAPTNFCEAVRPDDTCGSWEKSESMYQQEDDEPDSDEYPVDIYPDAISESTRTFYDD